MQNFRDLHLCLYICPLVVLLLVLSTLATAATTINLVIDPETLSDGNESPIAKQLTEFIRSKGFDVVHLSDERTKRPSLTLVITGQMMSGARVNAGVAASVEREQRLADRFGTKMLLVGVTMEVGLPRNPSTSMDVVGTVVDFVSLRCNPAKGLKLVTEDLTVLGRFLGQVQESSKPHFIFQLLNFDLVSAVALVGGTVVVYFFFKNQSLQKTGKELKLKVEESEKELTLVKEKLDEREGSLDLYARQCEEMQVVLKNTESRLEEVQIRNDHLAAELKDTLFRLNQTRSELVERERLLESLKRKQKETHADGLSHSPKQQRADEQTEASGRGKAPPSAATSHSYRSQQHGDRFYSTPTTHSASDKPSPSKSTSNPFSPEREGYY